MTMTTNGWNNWTGFGSGQRGWKASGVLTLITLALVIESYHRGDYFYALFAAGVCGINLEKMFTALEDNP